MILAYSNIFGGVHIQLFDEQKKLTDSLFVEEKKENGIYSRPDLLLSIIEILNKNTLSLSDITGIFVVNGPGKFTAVRTACIIANAFAKEKSIPVCAVLAEEYESAGRDFTNTISTKECNKTSFLKPVFSGPPRINRVIPFLMCWGNFKKNASTFGSERNLCLSLHN